MPYRTIRASERDRWQAMQRGDTDRMVRPAAAVTPLDEVLVGEQRDGGQRAADALGRVLDGDDALFLDDLAAYPERLVQHQVDLALGFGAAGDTVELHDDAVLRRVVRDGVADGRCDGLAGRLARHGRLGGRDGGAGLSADDGARGGRGRTWRGVERGGETRVASTRGASTAVGERRETGTRDALGARREASSGFGDGVREVRGDRGAGETGAEQHFFLAMPENGPYSHISVARGEEFSTRRCSEQRRRDSSQERCGRWTDRTKEGQWIERPGTAPTARV